MLDLSRVLGFGGQHTSKICLINEKGTCLGARVLVQGCISGLGPCLNHF